jgi:beta-lactamase class A
MECYRLVWLLVEAMAHVNKLHVSGSSRMKAVDQTHQVLDALPLLSLGVRSLALLLAIAPSIAFAQTSLQAKVAAIAKDAHGTVAVACLLPGTTLNCDLNPHNHSPMQSMFKYPLALTVLHLADTGKLFPDQRPGEPVNVILDRKVRFLPQDRIPGAYSPLQDRYPNANVDVTLRELIQLAAGQSDNGAEELLLRIIGGPAIVQSYIRSLGITAFQLIDSQPAYRDQRCHRGAPGRQ